MSTAFLLGLVIGGVALLLVQITVLRIHAFVALMVTSLVVAVAGGIPLSEVAGEIQRGMGSTLGYIAVVIGIGAIFGELLQRSGGAEAIATRLLRRFGEDRAPLALGLTGLIVAIPVFFDVAFILLVPLIYGLTRRTGRPILYFAIPLAAGIAVAHSFIPPTPGPVAVAGLLGADLGTVIAVGVAAGIPATLVAGIYFGRYISKKITVGVPDFAADEEPTNERLHPRPTFAVAAILVLLPLVLILSGTVSAVTLPEGNRMREVMALLGHPFTALLLTTLLSFYLIGTRCGFSASEVRDMATKSLEPVGLIILVTGAGGVLGKVLIAAGVGDALATLLAGSSLPVVLLGFAIAAVVRVAQGSATVSMVTAAGLLTPVIEVGNVGGLTLALATVAIASGATVLSHVNDSGFWLVGKYLGLSERDTLRSWTIMETLIGLVGLAVVLAISAFA
ncbi:MAG: GntP family permease [Rhodothermia bacterium]|nr:GntP family permease [Rhodothermia bacterium]